MQLARGALRRPGLVVCTVLVMLSPSAVPQWGTPEQDCGTYDVEFDVEPPDAGGEFHGATQAEAEAAADASLTIDCEVCPNAGGARCTQLVEFDYEYQSSGHYTTRWDPATGTWVTSFHLESFPEGCVYWSSCLDCES